MAGRPSFTALSVGATIAMTSSGSAPVSPILSAAGLITASPLRAQAADVTSTSGGAAVHESSDRVLCA